MKGPIVPKYNMGKLKQWTKLFTDMFTEKVKLVGATISCEGQIHVQSHFFAVDRQGLNIIYDIIKTERNQDFKLDIDGDVAKSMTAAILDKGFTIDSMMSQYQTFDWLRLYTQNHGTSQRKYVMKGDKACNDGRDPLKENKYGGDVANLYSMTPYELVFFKRGGGRDECKSSKDGDKVCNFDMGVDDAAKWIEQSFAANP